MISGDTMQIGFSDLQALHGKCKSLPAGES